MATTNSVNINIDFSRIQMFFGDLFSRLAQLDAGGVAMVLLAIILPPIAVLLKVGITTQFWVNIVLTILGVVPGQLHALWIVLF